MLSSDKIDMSHGNLNFPDGSDSKESACNTGDPMDWEDPLEEGMAAHSGIPAWRIPWTEEPGGRQPMGSQRVGHDWATKRSTGQLSTIPLFDTAAPKGILFDVSFP